jgi:hypothetical protein
MRNRGIVLEPASPDSSSINISISAAKLHVLQLEPIKAKMGGKWPRLSQLVHTLFEKSLKRAQGPLDQFILVGELSYVATFQGRSTEEAALACAAVAQEVCELLFGDGVDTISVRSVVGVVSKSHVRPNMQVDAIGAVLERTGRVKVFTRSIGDPVDGNASSVSLASRMPGEAGIKAQQLLTRIKSSASYFPVWDLERGISSSLIFSPVGNGAAKPSISVRATLPQGEQDIVPGLEIALLRAAGEYAQRVHASQKVCGVGAGVSCESLCSFAQRVRYVTALKAIPTTTNCPLLLRIEDVPAGMPLARLAEIVAMLAAPHVRVLIEFAPEVSIPDLNIKLGAAGIGAVLPESCTVAKAREIASNVARRVLRQRAFSFLRGLENEGLIRAATECQVRFGVGTVLDKGQNYTGLESVPDFPLRGWAQAQQSG